jgi:alanyl aminopeptidase
MGLDSLTSARSIQQPVQTNQDISNAFSAITYEKGGAVLEMFERWMGPETFREAVGLYLREHQGRTATSGDLLAALDETGGWDVSGPFQTFLTQPGVPLVTGTAESCKDGSRRVQLSQRRNFPIGSTGDPGQVWEIPLCVRHEGGTTCGALTDAEGHLDLPGCPDWWMPNADGGGYFRFSMSAADWTNLRTTGFARLTERGKMAVADSVAASFDRGAVDVKGLLPWFPKFVDSPLRQIAGAPMAPLRFMIRDAAPPELRGRVRSYAGRLYRKRYTQLGWRAGRRDSSDTKLLREAVIGFMVMDVRDREARARAARLGRAYAGYRNKTKQDAVDPQIAGLVLATAVQESGEGLFDHLLTRLDSSTDATMRNRILAALGHAEDPVLSTRALDLSLDPRLRVNEIGRVLSGQFRNPRTRERAWAWLMEHFDELTERFGTARGGALPWYAASLCSEEAATEVQRFFEPKVAEMPGGARNLAGAVEAVSLCAKRAGVIRPGVEQAFGAR